MKAFVKLQIRLFKNDPYWTPPLLREKFAYFNPERYRKLKNNPNTPLLALNDSRVSGRIMGLINEKANTQKTRSICGTGSLIFTGTSESSLTTGTVI